VQLRPYDPESKGIVERADGYLETSFLPGRVFTSPAYFNAQLAGWLPRANDRRVRRLGARPADLIGQDRAAMRPLPLARPEAGFTMTARLPRDYYLRVLGNDYSADPSAIGRMIDVQADLDTVTGRCDGAVIACHPRSWAWHQTITDPAHVATAARLRAGTSAPAAPAAGRAPTRTRWCVTWPTMTPGLDFGERRQVRGPTESERCAWGCE
jgi:hypothetical protein